MRRDQAEHEILLLLILCMFLRMLLVTRNEDSDHPLQWSRLPVYNTQAVATSLGISSSNPYPPLANLYPHSSSPPLLSHPALAFYLSPPSPPHSPSHSPHNLPSPPSHSPPARPRYSPPPSVTPPPPFANRRRVATALVYTPGAKLSGHGLSIRFHSRAVEGPDVEARAWPGEWV
ncbi:hypothetical protein R5R35_006241 [Gryllus longicercus]|uniref:Uncharacterized protein n=1 Tax=Gryllus longicercus TaxID=2509291 RepID=A0AAN9W4S9_9ORTH